MTGELRSPNASMAQIIEHFDIFSDPSRLIPFRSYEDGDSSSTTNKIAAFTMYEGVLYGNGIRTATSNATVYSASSIATPTWTDISFSSSGATRVEADLPFFIGYKGAIFGVRGGRYVWKFTISGASTDNTHFDLTAYSTVSNGIIHSRDDCMYLGYDNKIVRNNAGSWTAAVLTLPTNCKVTSICEYGNYLAIGTASTYDPSNSVVYLWDRDSSLATLSEKIDFGPGNLKALEEIDGALIGVSEGSNTGNLEGTITFRYWAGGGSAIQFQQYKATTAGLKLYKQRVNGRLVVPGNFVRESITHYGFWVVGRANPGAPFAASFGRLAVNDFTAANVSGTSMFGFIVVGDYLFFAYPDASLDLHMTKTNDAATYTATSLYESLVNPGMPSTDRSEEKKLYAVGVTTTKLSGSQQVVVKYRVDGGSWITILTKTTSSPDADLVGYQSGIIAAGDQFTDGREYEFRLESTGGAEITGLFYRYKTT